MTVVEPEIDELARRYEHRVGFFAHKVQRRFVLGTRWSDELISAGYWGLFKALENRRPDAHDRELSAYVSQRIHGAVIDAARACLNQLAKRELCAGVPGQEDRQDLFAECGSVAWQMDEGALDPERLVGDSRKRGVIRAALELLSSDERETLYAYMEGASLSEIARAQSVSLPTLRARFKRTTRKLRAKAPSLRRVLLDQESA
jgi:RNA polymerase sigma factor (sigma-70 family)